jgi:hypothetical protein
MSEPFPDPLFEMRFCLNTALCQSPPTISKTMKAMNYIKHFAVVSRFTAGHIENGIHHMTVILTNNNLSETTQWKMRLRKNLRLNTMILSSSKKSDMKSLDQLFGKMLRCKKPDGLPDLLVMCTHEKRTSDLKELIETLKNKTFNFTKFGIHSISLTIMFDEADKNMRLISSCLREINPLITNGTGNVKYDNVIRDIHFITATPMKAFWAELKKHGITSLQNINTAIARMDSDSVLHKNYAELMKDYRFLSEHSIHMNENMTDDPFEYAISILNNLDMTIPRTVFAPSRIYLDDHDLMQQELTRRAFNVYIDNSKKKGFYDLKGDFITLEHFNKTHSITGELYETFVKWRQLHPNDHLAITGLLNITRGITFNTIGFNFTDMIISAYHAKDIAALVQLFGRANGGKQYVELMNLHCPREVYNKVKEFVDMAVDILNKNPEEFEEKHFRGQTPREKLREQQEVAWTVPKVFQLSDEEWESIKKVKGKSGKDKKEWDKKTILPLIAKNDSSLEAEIKNMECFQVTAPDAENTYKKYITDFTARAESKTKYIMGLHKDSKNKDGYQVFLDNKNKKVIVSVYYGSKLPKDDSDSDDE